MLAPRHQLPRFIERAKAQTLSCPVYGEAGDVLVPSAGVWNLYDEAGALKVGPVVVANLGSNDVVLASPDTAGLDLSDRWTEEWVLTIDGEVHTFRREAAVVLRVLYPVISDIDLERVHPGLADYIPSTQRSWGPQIAEAFDQLQGRLLGKGRRPNLIIGSWALRNLHLYWSLFLVAELLRVESSGRWAQLAEDWGKRVQAEWDSLTFLYDDGDDGAPDEDVSAVPTLYLTDVPGYAGRFTRWRG